MTARAAVEAFLDRLDVLDDEAIFVGVHEPAVLRALADEIDAKPAAEVPLRGLTFAAKGNIDVEGLVTTAGCPSFASRPETSATVVARLTAAGAVPVGTTNLDQFATGLVGTRSPYGAPRNPHDARLVPGGSSSGSAVAVARGLVDFALGTDTAGSGRVPAAFCGIVGLKPTVGRLPCTGVVPAVRSADVVSVFARTVALATQVADLAAGPDGVDAFARAPRASPIPPRAPGPWRVGVVTGEWLTAKGAAAGTVAHYAAATAALVAAGAETVAGDLDALLDAGDLLYGGAFVAERTAAVGEFLADATDGDSTVASIIAGGARFSAVDLVRAREQVADVRLATAELFAGIDAFVLPTIPRAVTVDEIADDPVGPNTELGRFTTFANLVDLCGLTLPVAGEPGVHDPTASVTMYGQAWAESTLAALAPALAGELLPDPGDDRIELVVAGAHLRGQPLEGQLFGLGATWCRTTRTAPTYRMWALPGGPPHKPALVHDPAGAAIEVDVWSLDAAALGTFLTMIPAPLALGTVELEDGSTRTGFVAEGRAVDGAIEITDFGGWRAYVAAR